MKKYFNRELFNYVIVLPSIIVVMLSVIIAGCILIAFVTSPSFPHSFSCIEHKYEWEQATDDCDKLPEWQQIFCKERNKTA